MISLLEESRLVLSEHRCRIIQLRRQARLHSPYHQAVKQVRLKLTHSMNTHATYFFLIGDL